MEPHQAQEVYLLPKMELYQLWMGRIVDLTYDADTQCKSNQMDTGRWMVCNPHADGHTKGALWVIWVII